MNNKRFEYEMVRNELISLIEQRMNLSIAMYTLSIAVLGFAFELGNKYLFILIFVVIIPFQGLINLRRMYMAKCGAYVKVFFEYEKDMPKWEMRTHIAEITYFDTYMKKNRIEKIVYQISRSGTTLFSLIAVFSFVANSIYIKEGRICINLGDFFICLFIFFMFIVVVILNKTALRTLKTYEEYEEIFREMKEKQ